MSVGAPRALASSGQKPITEILHPLSAAEEPLSVTVGGDKQEMGLTNGTPVETSSPASTSSLFNRLQLDDDLEADVRDPYADSTEMRDLFVTVDDPKKHVSTMETYITYRVSTKTSRVEFDLPEYCVRRRYQDFDWLRIKLEDSQPTHLIPPLPEKFVMKGVVDRFSEEFVETRMKALDKFLKRVADHPVLSFNPHLNAFLTVKDLNKRQGLALLSKVGESVKHVAGGYKLRARPAEFCAMGEYLDTFNQKLGTIDRIAQRILKEQSEYLTELREYGGVYSSWVGSEEELRRPLEGVAGCVTTSCGALEDLGDNMSLDFLPVLREYVLYLESIKNVLRKRDQSQAEYEGRLEAAILRKQEDRTPMPLEVEKCQDKVECFNADLKADWERWQSNKRHDFKQLLTGMADRNINSYEKSQAAWESLITLLQDKQTEDKTSETN
ncbi:sorting nexin-30 isoform X1 [Gymnodraco acuticeps]|uniref:Sorting nexin-30 n=1 Tax=Gymnodraco acuticeps TaxID=8218 RepID=A0A6P8V4L8_GYMAC|nr:sorting nexin-30 isoform X1 [Gymnodraco acuticeps]